MTTTKVTLRLEKDVKDEFEQIVNALGMNMTTGFNVLAKAVIRHGGFPFEISQPFYNAANMARLNNSIQQAKDGQLIYKTAEELGLEDE